MKHDLGHLICSLLNRVFDHREIANCERQIYLTRWYLLRTKPLAVFLHWFRRSDEDRALHDHPWPFITLILWRGYFEHCQDGTIRRRWPLTVHYRPAEWRHRVELIGGRKAVTIVIRFRERRLWGYNRTMVYAKNRNRLREYIRLQPLYQSFCTARLRAKKKGLPFTIRYEDIPPAPLVCPVLGIVLSYNSGRRTDNSPSLDRIIPSLGYVPGNVEIISFRANKLKNNGTVRELDMVLAYMRSRGCK